MRAYIRQTPNEKSIMMCPVDSGGPVVEIYEGCRSAEATILSAGAEIWLYAADLWLKGRSGPIVLQPQGKK
jgi:hypothetical protein